MCPRPLLPLYLTLINASCCSNTRESRPMPSVIMSRGFSTGNSSASLPFNQPPTVHILKRPLPSASASPANHHTTAEETLQDREARYQAARERIFGSSTQSEHQETSESGNDCFINKPIPASSNSSKVLRELRGPSYLGDNLNDADKGFGDRRLKRSDPSDIQV